MFRGPRGPIKQNTTAGSGAGAKFIRFVEPGSSHVRPPPEPPAAITGGTLGASLGHVKRVVPLEHAEGVLEVLEQILGVLDTHGNSYKAIG